MDGADQIDLGDFTALVVRKDIRNIHLSVHPPAGAVTVAAPRGLGAPQLRAYVISKLDWIKKQRRQFQNQERESPREYIERESHYLWGRRCLLSIEEVQGPAEVRLAPGRMILRIPPGMAAAQRHVMLDAWYRAELRRRAEPLIRRWEARLGVSISRLFIQKMKTKWGSCTPSRRNIRLNTDLAKKPPCCLEYLIVHELAHLIEPTHNARFIALMDHHLPHWRQRRITLNRLPVSQAGWGY